MAQLILVNKADSEADAAANQALFEYRNAMRTGLIKASKRKDVLPVSGKTRRGIKEAWEAIKEIWKAESPTLRSHRRQQQVQKCTFYALEMGLKKR